MPTDYIKKVYIVDNTIKLPKVLFGACFHGFLIIKVGQNDKTNGCNLKTGYKMKFLKHGRAGQLCKKHTPIGFSGKYTIKFALAV